MSRFHGYKINTTNISKVEKLLYDARCNLALAEAEEYHRLLSDELNHLITDISLNVVPRPEVSILDAAVNILNGKIQQAETMNLGTEYDLRSGVSVMPDKDDKCVYLIFNASNASLEEAFAETEGIEDFTVEISESTENTESTRARKWGELQQRYRDKPILLNAALTTTVKVNPNLLRLDDKETRATVRARHHVMGHYMQMYSGGREIQPAQLMYITDLALTRLVTPEGTAEMEQKKDQLMTILTDVSLEDIMRDPKAPVPSETSPTAQT